MNRTLSHLPNNFQYKRWVYLFIFVHLILWTVVPFLIRYNLPMDSIEGTIWGHQFEWGYDKNPFLNGWLTALAIFLGGSSGWMVYLFSQISVALCFWAVWQLAKNMLSEGYALIAVFILEGIQYFNFHAIDFNDNTLELSLWTLASYSFYVALKNPRHRINAWIFTGIFAGLGMMAKYYTASLLTAMALFLLLFPENRKQLKTLPPYLGLTVFLAIILPHFIWLFFHDFITVRYVFERTDSIPSWINHLYFPLQFALQQFQVFLPAVVLFILIFFSTHFIKNLKTAESNANVVLNLNQTSFSFNRNFLIFVGLGPFVLTLLLSFIFGLKLHSGWGMPLQSLWGILLLMFIPPKLTKNKLYHFIVIMFLWMFILLIGYSFSLVYSNDQSSANFPGKELAKIITTEWHDHYHTQLNYVSGTRWISGNIGFYSPDHPAVFIEWNINRSPWINLNDLKEKGGVFVWEISRHKTLPQYIQKAYPQLENFTLFEFPWHRDKDNHLPLIKVGMAMLPPASHRPLT